MKKILFPFETNHVIYREAYVYAVKFARNLGAELIMLNVFEMDDAETPTQRNIKRLSRINISGPIRKLSNLTGII